jgi:hypothetical protein
MLSEIEIRSLVHGRSSGFFYEGTPTTFGVKR